MVIICCGMPLERYDNLFRLEFGSKELNKLGSGCYIVVWKCNLKGGRISLRIIDICRGSICICWIGWNGRLSDRRSAPATGTNRWPASSPIHSLGMRNACSPNPYNCSTTRTANPTYPSPNSTSTTSTSPYHVKRKQNQIGFERRVDVKRDGKKYKSACKK